MALGPCFDNIISKLGSCRVDCWIEEYQSHPGIQYDEYEGLSPEKNILVGNLTVTPRRDIENYPSAHL